VPMLAAPGGEVNAERGVRARDGHSLTGPDGVERAGDEQVPALIKPDVREVALIHGR
jgi:hypothetical protein